MKGGQIKTLLKYYYKSLKKSMDFAIAKQFGEKHAEYSINYIEIISCSYSVNMDKNYTTTLLKGRVYVSTIEREIKN